MPVLFEVQSSLAGYRVESEPGALAAQAASMRDGVVIADDYFAGQLAASGVAAIGLPATEATKSLDALGDIIVRMRKAGANRGTHLWAVGGGAIQDVAAFVASIYMRGISWTYLPTTLLGMVDSCIGGKSSINVGQYKNIVGSFHTPTRVLIDATLTQTLSAEQRIAGLAEAAKICYCRGADVFAEYLDKAPSCKASTREFESIIALSLGAKKWFVETDEFDRAERLLLNLGHTFGHALEGASGYRISHGVAVGVGILCAFSLSAELSAQAPGGAAPALERHVRELLGGMGTLPGILKAIDVDDTFERLTADKKHEAANYRFVTFDATGRVQLIRLSKNNETRAAVVTALRRTMETLAR